MKRFLSLTVALFFLFVSATIPVSAIVPGDNTAPSASSLTYGELQKMFIDHLSEQQISLTVGTHEYYQYVQTLLNDNDAHSLSNHPFYLQIHAYLIEYSLLYRDYLYGVSTLKQNIVAGEQLIAQLSVDNPCLRYNAVSKELTFKLSNDFLSKTLAQSKAGNEAKFAASGQISAPDSAASTTANYTYSPSDAIQYARRYAHSYNRSYPYYGGYFDGGDCTNFVSQCVFAGGLPMSGSYTSGGIHETSTLWYCLAASPVFPDYAISTSWIRVSDFSTYMRGKAVRWTIVSTLDELIAECRPGDVVQLMTKQTGSLKHSLIISKKDANTAYYCAHSSEAEDENVRNKLNEALYSFVILSFQEAPSGSGVSLDPCEPCGDEKPRTTYTRFRSSSLDRVTECTAHNGAHDAEKYIYTYDICCSDHDTVVGTCYKTVYICISD